MKMMIDYLYEKVQSTRKEHEEADAEFKAAEERYLKAEERMKAASTSAWEAAEKYGIALQHLPKSAR